MAKGAGALTLSNIRSSNFLVTVLVLVIVLALFFIPEIINFQKYIEGKEADEVATAPVLPSVEPPVKKVAPPAATEDSPESPLGKVLAMVQGDPASEGIIEKDSSYAPDISWSDLRGRRALRELRHLRLSIRHFQTRLNRNYHNTKEAVAMLGEAVDRLISDRGVENEMSAGAAHAMIEELVANVTHSLGLDGAARADLIDWSSIQLLSVLRDSPAAQFRESAVPPFNPQPRLVSFELVPRFRDGTLESLVMQRLRVSVVGREVNHVTFISEGGARVTRMRPSRPDHFGRRVAGGPVVMRVNEPVLVLVTDSLGETFEKTYEFFPRSKVFGVHRPGVTRIPFSGGFQSDRLDTFFAMGPGGLTVPGGQPSVAAAGSPQEGSHPAFQRF